VRIAVIGSGISGLAAASLLARSHDVELFEREPRLGGHAHTHRVERDGRVWHLDTGFLVYNRRTYPNFVRLLDALGVRSRPSDMSFGVQCRRCGVAFSSRGLAGLLAQRRRIVDPRYLRMLVDIARFFRGARRLLASEGALAGDSLGTFLDAGRYSGAFVRHFLLPMAGAIWSASGTDVRAFPARSFVRFYDNHGLLSATGAPPWWTIEGGSARYVQALAAQLAGRIHLATPVEAVWRQPDAVEIRTGDAIRRRFDAVVIAVHANDALKMLADPSVEEARALGRFRYSTNRAVLHTDTSVLPGETGARASWNSDVADCRDERTPVSVTYDISRLQALDGVTRFCVTLNGTRPLRGDILAEMTYTHPIMDGEALAGQRELAALNAHGARRTFFCGAHLRWGFHEDGLVSAIDVARAIGATVAAPVRV
jgi:predicted NAD/FAD-binding protein